MELPSGTSSYMPVLSLIKKWILNIPFSLFHLNSFTIRIRIVLKIFLLYNPFETTLHIVHYLELLLVIVRIYNSSCYYLVLMYLIRIMAALVLTVVSFTEINTVVMTLLYLELTTCCVRILHYHCFNN